MELRRYFSILRRALLLIIICPVVCIGVVGYYLHSLPNQWTGVTSVWERPPYDRGVSVYPEAMAMPQTVDMHLADLGMIATSYTVRQRAVEALSAEGISLDPVQLINDLKVEPEPGSQIIRIQVTSTNEEEARKASDAIRMEFVRYYRDLMVGPTSDSRSFIEKQLDRAKMKLQQAREARKEFQMNNAVVQLDAQSQVLIQRTSEIENQAITAGVNEGEAASRLHAIDTELSHEPEMKILQSNISDNPIYQKLLDDKVQVETELGTQMATRGKNHPEVQNLLKRLSEINLQIKTQAPKIVSQEIKSQNQVYTQTMVSRISTEAERAGAAARQSALQAALENKKAELGTLPEEAMKMAQYDLDVRAAESTYALLQQKLDEARIREKEAEGASAIQVVNEAYTMPVEKKVILKTAIAFLASLFFAIAFAMFLAYIDPSIRTRVQAEQLLGIPVLASVPLSRSHMLTKHSGNIAVLSAYEMIAGTLAGVVGSSGACVLVAGAEPESGRSTTAANLAITLAKNGARVILVDGDMRNPNLHTIFGVSNKPGLSNVLAEAISLEDALMPTKIEGLLFLPSGPATNNPIRMLRSQNMEKMIQQISALADYIVFDSPSGAVFADAAVIAAYVKNVLISHSAGRSASGAEVEFMKKLDVVGANIIGAVLNKVRAEDSGSYATYRRLAGDKFGGDKAKVGAGNVRAIPPRGGDNS